jgi:hypothetical protein
MSAAIWCSDHAPTKTIVHRMHDIVNETGLNALQLYVQNFKQADLALTGTVRKANLITTAAKMFGTPTNPGIRRSSNTNAITNGASNRIGENYESTAPSRDGVKICATCGVDASPRWYAIDDTQERELTNGHYGTMGSEAQMFVDQRKHQCHKCRKAHARPGRHPPPKEPSPVAEPVRPPPPLVAQVVTGPPPLASPPPPAPPPPPPESRPRAPSTYTWIPATVHTHTQAPSAIPVVASVPVVASAPLQAPVQVQPPAIPPTLVNPPQPHSYPPPARDPYGDWHNRPSSHHGSPPTHQLNGVPPPMAPASLSNLSALRPPPMAVPPPPPVPTSLQNGHMGQPFTNGLPPSPRRIGGPPTLQNTSPYIQSHYHAPPPHHGPHGMASSGPLLRGPEPFSSRLLPQRSSFGSHQTSPPVSRDGPVLGREPPPMMSGSAPRPPDNHPPSGASASPSLRNLLS